MNEKNKMIMEEYRAQKPEFEKLESEVVSILQSIADKCNIRIYAINHRIKEEKSLAGKLERKSDKYSSLSDITDILGARVVCFFSDDVDKLAAKIEENFTVDWESSIDKRKYLNVNAFGYLSLHYICSLKQDGDYPAELKNKRFEVQMCSLIQHIWAVMEHDLGYKTKYGVPNAVRRDFYRLAGLLEIADEHFVNIRNRVFEYTKEVHQKIITDMANDVPIDSVSLEEYMYNSKNIHSFMEAVSNICEAEISQESPENYLVQLEWLKKNTIGDLQKMLTENYSLALQMIVKRLAMADLDILSSTVVLRFLCRAELIQKKYSKELMADFFMISMKNREQAERAANSLFEEGKNLIGK